MSSVSTLIFMSLSLSLTAMSEVIEKLAEECWMKQFHFNEHDGPHDYYEFDYQKFAKLMLKECVKVLNQAKQDDIDEDYHLNQELEYYVKRHFKI